MGLFALFMTTLLAALKNVRSGAESSFELGAAFSRIVQPVGVADWVQLVGIGAFAGIGGLFTAAVFAARRR